MSARDFTHADKADVLRRELAMRRTVYPRQVQRGKMTGAQAAWEIEVMEAVLRDYEPPSATADLFGPRDGTPSQEARADG